MAKLQLTISADYVADWSVYEGIREIIQNALDARDSGFPMSIGHDGQQLIVSNQGVRLDRSVWLMGVTSKLDDPNARGMFGEGMKIGALALVRAGRPIQIVNDDETWTCSLQESDLFSGQQVLTIQTRKRPTTGHFEVRIPCSSEEWADYQLRFLDLCPAPAAINVPDTQILTDEEQRGRIYVKGIFVQEMPDLHAGYNFVSKVKTDRDRRIVNDFDFRWYAGSAWVDALYNERISPEEMLRFLSTDTVDGNATGDRYCPQEKVLAVGKTFTDLYGESAIPVLDPAGVNEAGHFGKTGLIRPKGLVSFFQGHPELDLETLRSSHRAEVTAIYEFLDLDESEQEVLELAVELIEPAAKRHALSKVHPRLRIVDFSDPDILGTHKYDDDLVPMIRLSRKVLASLDQAIRILVHEVAHDNGGDGSVSHERTEGLLFGTIISDLALARTPLQRRAQRLGLAAV